MIKYKLDDVLCNIIAQVSGYKQDMDLVGIDTTELIELTEFLVNEVSKIKSLILELPSDTDTIS